MGDSDSGGGGGGGGGDNNNTAKRIILARRTAFIAAAVASMNVACGKEKPQVCLSVVQVVPDGGRDDAGTTPPKDPDAADAAATITPKKP